MFASRLMLTVFTFGEEIWGLEWISTLLMVPCWPKVKSKLRTMTCKASEALDGFQFYILIYFTVTSGLQNPAQTLQPLKNTSWFFSLHIFCSCLKCLLCFYAWWIPNLLFLPNLKQMTSLLRGPWNFLKVIFAPYLQYYTFWIYFHI